MARPLKLLYAAACVLGLLALGACEDPLGVEAMRTSGKVTAPDPGKSAGARATVIGVNAYLWRAALDTVSFMPLASDDPYGGVIITDWHTPAQSPDDRFKINVYILGAGFHANNLKVVLFRQTRDRDGVWVNAAVSPMTVHQLESKILERAYEMRRASAAEEE